MLRSILNSLNSPLFSEIPFGIPITPMPDNSYLIIGQIPLHIVARLLVIRINLHTSLNSLLQPGHKFYMLGDQIIDSIL